MREPQMREPQRHRGTEAGAAVAAGQRQMHRFENALSGSARRTFIAASVPLCLCGSLPFGVKS
jgi:hypothetical protein